MSTRSPQGLRLGLATGLLLTSGIALAQSPESAKPFELTSDLVLWMYGIGIGAITLAWVGIVWMFAWRKALNDLLDLEKRGPVIKFVTVTYIIVVIVTLSLVGQLESSHVSTLLGASRHDPHIACHLGPHPHQPATHLGVAASRPRGGTRLVPSPRAHADAAPLRAWRALRLTSLTDE
jgi:hypothetical protein